MTINFIGISVKENGSKPIDFCMALDNEEWAVVNENPSLFDGVTSIKKLLTRLPLAFKDPAADDDEEEEPRDMVRDFDYENAFPKFCRQAEKLQKIDEVLVYATNNSSGTMVVLYVRYDFMGGRFLVGQKHIDEKDAWRDEFFARMNEKDSGQAYNYHVRFDPAKKRIAKKKPDSPLVIKNNVVLGVRDDQTPKEITVPEGITEIGAFAFANLEQIRRIVLPGSVRVIHEKAFSGCENLKEMILPEGLQQIGIAAFESTGLEKLSLPDSLMYIGDMAFAGCEFIMWLRLSRGIKDYTMCAWYLETDEDEPLTLILPKGCTPDEYTVSEDEDFWEQDGLIVKMESK